jgi:hypothetical protein
MIVICGCHHHILFEQVQQQQVRYNCIPAQKDMKSCTNIISAAAMSMPWPHTSCTLAARVAKVALQWQSGLSRHVL